MNISIYLLDLGKISKWYREMKNKIKSGCSEVSVRDQENRDVAVH